MVRPMDHEAQCESCGETGRTFVAPGLCAACFVAFTGNPKSLWRLGRHCGVSDVEYGSGSALSNGSPTGTRLTCNGTSQVPQGCTGAGRTSTRTSP